MEYVTLKAANLRVSKLALGTWSFSGSKNWGPNDEKESIDTINLALDLGINFLDSAARYNDGEAERILGRAIKARRKDAIVATKIYTGHLDYEGVLRECENSLRRLDTDYIDVYQIHWPSKTIPFEETIRGFEKLKQDGKIRAIGVCNFGPKCIEGFSGHGVVTNQLPYNLLWRQIEDEVIPASQKAGMSVWPYCPLAQGLLTGKFKTIDDVPLPRREVRFYSSKWKQGLHSDTGFETEIFEFLPKLQKVADQAGLPMATVALDFLKTRTGVDSVLVGARNLQQLKDNLKMYETQVPADVRAAALRLSDELKPRMGKNPDLWQSENGGRFY